METIMPSTHRVGQTVRSIGRSRNARWMDWQERRWTHPKAQLDALAEHGLTPSRSTVFHWRNGVLPETDTLIILIDKYPSLYPLFWPEHQEARALILTQRFDELAGQIDDLRDAL